MLELYLPYYSSILTLSLLVSIEQAAKAKKAQRIEREEAGDPMPASGGVPTDANAQMQQQEQLMQQMQQQQEQFMGGAGGVPGAQPGMGGADPMAQMSADSQALMQQREAMLAGAADTSGQLGATGGDSSAAAMQQSMGAGLFGAGQNPYALQAAGLGGGVGFPGGMGAFGLNSASNPYLANALANQAAYMQAPGQAGLSALMGESFVYWKCKYE